MCAAERSCAFSGPGICALHRRLERETQSFTGCGLREITETGLRKPRYCDPVTGRITSLKQLTPRRQQICKMLSMSKTYRQIAGELRIGKGTVEKAVWNVGNEIGEHGKHAVIQWIREHP